MRLHTHDTCSNFAYFREPCIEKLILQRLPNIQSNIAIREQEEFEEKIADVHEVVFADRFVEEQVRRSCNVSLEDGPKHGRKHVGTGGGKRRGVRNARR